MSAAAAGLSAPAQAPERVMHTRVRIRDTAATALSSLVSGLSGFEVADPSETLRSRIPKLAATKGTHYDVELKDMPSGLGVLASGDLDHVLRLRRELARELPGLSGPVHLDEGSIVVGSVVAGVLPNALSADPRAAPVYAVRLGPEVMGHLSAEEPVADASSASVALYRVERSNCNPLSTFLRYDGYADSDPSSPLLCVYRDPAVRPGEELDLADVEHRLLGRDVQAIREAILLPGLLPPGTAARVYRPPRSNLSPRSAAFQYGAAVRDALRLMAHCEASLAAARPPGSVPACRRAQADLFLTSSDFARLDAIRHSVLPTTPGHHALKRLQSVSHVIDFLDFARGELPEPQAGAALHAMAECLQRFHLQSRPPRPGAPFSLGRFDLGGYACERATLVSASLAGLVRLAREYHRHATAAGGAIRLDPGDREEIVLMAGSWLSLHRFHSHRGAWKGTLVRVGLPAVVMKDEARCFALPVGVLALPSAAPAVLGESALAAAAAAAAVGPQARARAEEALRKAAAADLKSSRGDAPLLALAVG
eukprot:tig00001041_g6551.t1